jgi:hypothetical protein
MNKQDITIIDGNEYAEILLQAVAEIRTARSSIALQVNSATHAVYWNLGKLFFENSWKKVMAAA